MESRLRGLRNVLLDSTDTRVSFTGWVLGRELSRWSFICGGDLGFEEFIFGEFSCIFRLGFGYKFFLIWNFRSCLFL